MADDLHENNRDLKELARAVRELTLRVQRLERRVDEISHPAGQSRSDSTIFIDQAPGAAHSALESRIGSQWLNKIGVIAVLFGVAYLLRYAFVQRWISAAAWIWLGVCSGLIVIVSSEWFRRLGYRVLSLSLKATGIGISYLSLWAGLELYKLLTGPETFTGFVSITILAGVLALRESAEVLAGLALVGGFLTPLLISIPSLEVPLFSYLAILDCAIAVIIVRRDWRRLLPLALAGTVVLCAIWYYHHYRPTELWIAVAAATLFFSIFCWTLIIARIRSPGSSTLLVDFTEVLTPLVYFAALYLLVNRADHYALALPATALATVYFTLAWKLSRRFPTAVNRAVPLYGGIGIVLIALSLGVVLHVDWLSLGWFMEAAMLMAIGFWRDLPWLRWGSLLLLCAAVVKAFAYDVWQLDLAYRTLSFIGLGVLLLVISFAYQRYGFSLLAKIDKDARPLP